MLKVCFKLEGLTLCWEKGGSNNKTLILKECQGFRLIPILPCPHTLSPSASKGCLSFVSFSFSRIYYIEDK